MENELPLISIAMATYNGEQFLLEQLESILKQTYKNIEIIICDDNSTDTTLQILESYKKKLPITIIQNKKNYGIITSFENALNLCKGEFIALSDQDDIFFPEKLEILYKNIGKSLLIHSDSIVIDEFNNIIFSSHFKKFKDKNKYNFTDYLKGNNVTGNSVLFKKDLLQFALPFPKNIRIHDHYLAMCASYTNNIIYYPKTLQYYRQHKSNAIGVKKSSYNNFLKNLKKDIRSYITFLKINKFKKNEQDIKIYLEIKLGIIRGNYVSNFSFLNRIRTTGFTRLYLFYLILNPNYPYKIRKLTYDIINTIR
jgi:glycosyltransferase involved in cell wall biosynthesis